MRTKDRKLESEARRAHPGRLKRSRRGHNPKGNRAPREVRRSW